MREGFDVQDNGNASFEAVTNRLNGHERDIESAVRELSDSKPHYELLARQAEWHGLGVIYHARGLAQAYQRFCGDVAARVDADCVGAFMSSLYFTSFTPW